MRTHHLLLAIGGSDRIDGRGGDGIDRMHGGGDDDRVLGQGDTCLGEAPCAHFGDLLSGGAGDDEIVGGGPGLDWVRFVNARRGVVVDLTAGTSSGQGIDSLRGVDQAMTTPYDDEVSGLRGEAYAVTRGGADIVTVADAEWIGTVLTGAGADRVTLVGRGGASTGPGDDVVETTGSQLGVHAAGGDDVVRLGSGGYADAGSGDDVVEGSDRVDHIRGGPGTDQVRAGAGNDLVEDGPGASTIEGGEGDDRIVGGRGDDSFDGGPGTDLISYATLSGETGVVLDLVADTASGGSGDDGLTGFENAFGSPQSDTLHGDPDRNLMYGFGGHDVVHGGGGDDHLVGLGTVEAYGDAGDDLLEMVAWKRTVDGLRFDGGDGRDQFMVSGRSASTSSISRQGWSPTAEPHPWSGSRTPRTTAAATC